MGIRVILPNKTFCPKKLEPKNCMNLKKMHKRTPFVPVWWVGGKKSMGIEK
jgi:hypothetical protein